MRILPFVANTLLRRLRLGLGWGEGRVVREAVRAASGGALLLWVLVHYELQSILGYSYTLRLSTLGISWVHCTSSDLPNFLSVTPLVSTA